RGLGIGLWLPTFPIAVQNAFPAKEIGVVTASVQFFRSIGATIGVAIMGTFLTPSLHNNLTAGLPPDVRQAIPADTIAAIDPQALASPDAQRAPAAQFAGIPDGARLLPALLATMPAAPAAPP